MAAVSSQLHALAEAYREAVGARDAHVLPLAKSVQYSENGHRLRLDQGLWATATAVPAPYLSVADPRTDQLVLIGVVPEGAHSLVYCTRLRVLAGLVSEIETLVVTKRDALNLLGTQRMSQARPVRREVLAQQPRLARERLAEVPQLYFDGVQSGDASNIPLAAGCVRRVNGIPATPPDDTPPDDDVREVLTGEWGLPDLSALSEAEKINQGIFGHIDEIDQRRVVAIDEHRQLVAAAAVFQQRGAATSIPGLGLDTLPPAMRKPVSLLTFHVFMLDNGKIVAIDRVAVDTPLGTSHGWPASHDPVLAASGGGN